jgi:hypothetical protein
MILRSKKKNRNLDLISMSCHKYHVGYCVIQPILNNIKKGWQKSLELKIVTPRGVI